MQKITKLLTYIFVIFCAIGGNINAINFDSSLFGTSSLESESKKVVNLDYGITKTETISTLMYDYHEDLNNVFEKYITVRMNITYSESFAKKIIAVATTESNFRYNSVTKRAQCLSTSRSNIANHSNCVLDVFSRRSNIKIGVGQSVAHVKLNFDGDVCDDTYYKISCDFLGNIKYD